MAASATLAARWASVEDMGLSSGNFWRDRNVLVTGATGLLGGWLIKALMSQQASVICLVRDWMPQSDLLREKELSRVILIRGDITDSAVVERTLIEYEIATVFHLAAQTQVPIANCNPVSTFESNIAGTWRLLEACRKAPKVSQIFVASSDKAYGTSPALPYKESTPLNSQYPYDVSKTCTDLIARCYATTFDLPVVVTRCGNLYGGGDLNWNRLIPGTIRSVLRGEAPIIRSNGLQLRDYIYVEDAASAYLRLAEKATVSGVILGEAFNISADTPRSTLEVARQVIKISGKPLEPQVLNEADNEIPEQYLDSEKIRRAIDWTPKFDLESGLMRTMKWYRDFFLKKDPGDNG